MTYKSSHHNQSTERQFFCAINCDAFSSRIFNKYDISYHTAPNLKKLNFTAIQQKLRGENKGTHFLELLFNE